MASKSIQEIFKATKWCQSNGIKIYPQPLDSFGKKLKIVVEKNGEPSLGERIYTNEQVYIKIEALYVFYFQKYAKKEKKLSA